MAKRSFVKIQVPTFIYIVLQYKMLCWKYGKMGEQQMRLVVTNWKRLLNSAEAVADMVTKYWGIFLIGLIDIYGLV